MSPHEHERIFRAKCHVTALSIVGTVALVFGINSDYVVCLNIATTLVWIWE